MAAETDLDKLAAAARRLAEREPAFAYCVAYPFRPGPYRFDPSRLTRVDSSTADESASVAVDSGALIVADAAALPQLAAHLDWEAYDRTLQAGGDEVIAELIEQLGGPRFAIIHADADRNFAGDGTYHVHADALHPA